MNKTIIAITLIVVVAIGCGLWLRVSSDRWQTECYVKFDRGESDEAKVFERSLVERGYEPEVRSNVVGPERTSTVTVIDGGLLGGGSGVEDEVAAALNGTDAGQLEGESCLARPLFGS